MDMYDNLHSAIYALTGTVTTIQEAYNSAAIQTIQRSKTLTIVDSSKRMTVEIVGRIFSDAHNIYQRSAEPSVFAVIFSSLLLSLGWVQRFRLGIRLLDGTLRWKVTETQLISGDYLLFANLVTETQGTSNLSLIPIEDGADQRGRRDQHGRGRHGALPPSLTPHIPAPVQNVGGATGGLVSSSSTTLCKIADVARTACISDQQQFVIANEEKMYPLDRDLDDNILKQAIGAKGIPFVVTHDARTIRYPDPHIKVDDTVVIDIETGKITDYVKFDSGNLCMITGGRNMGRVGIVGHRERHPGSFDIVHVKDAIGNTFATRENNVFIIGKGSSALVSLPADKGIKLSIAEERDKRLAQKQKGLL